MSECSAVASPAEHIGDPAGVMPGTAQQPVTSGGQCSEALTLLGFGRAEIVRVPTNDQGRIRPDALPDLDERTILILQAGNVTSGAIDPFDQVVPQARRAGAW